jgi:hypothetical protein
MRAWTLGGAFAEFDDDRKGRIAVGQLADFVVLAADPTRLKQEAIKDITVEKTFVGGRAVFYGRGPPDFVRVARYVPLVFDAKSVEGDRWSWDLLAIHQAQDLTAAEAQGATAFLALRIGGLSYVARWSALGEPWWAWKQTHRKGSRAPVPSFRNGTADHSLTPIEGADWLPAIIGRRIGE